MRHVDTFFRGYRREVIIDGAQILCNAAGEKRLKLAMKLKLEGDQLVGMPTWVSEPYDDVAKPEFAVKSIASTMELDPMMLHCYALPPGEKEDEKELITLDSVRMTGFKIERDGDEEPGIVLRFAAYLPRTGRFLKFADDNFNSSVFIRFEPAQMALLDDNPNIKPAEPFDAERREATSAKHDGEFPPSKKKVVEPTGKKKQPAPKPATPAKTDAPTVSVQ